MPRFSREADNAYDAINRMLALLRLKKPQEALKVGKQSLGARQDREYDRATRIDDDRESVASAARPRRMRQSERFRQYLLEQASPKMLLAPVNAVFVYLDTHPMWTSWDLDATSAINRRLLPFLQGLDSDNPLPDDSRLALPFTAAGFFLYRALGVDPKSATRTADVYQEILDGILTIAGLRVPDDLDERFRDSADDAHLLLLHALRFGLDAYDNGLILLCPLQAKCRKHEPFYVTTPGKTDHHGLCRTAASRSRAM